MEKARKLRLFYYGSIAFALIDFVVRRFESHEFKVKYMVLNNVLMVTSILLLLISSYLYNKEIRKY